jgi:hypothetical protein
MITELEDEFCVAMSKQANLPPLKRTYGVQASDALGVHIVRLLNLNPGLINFRSRDMAAMDEATKLQLIADFNKVLEINLAQ